MRRARRPHAETKVQHLSPCYHYYHHLQYPWPDRQLILRHGSTSPRWLHRPITDGNWHEKYHMQKYSAILLYIRIRHGKIQLLHTLTSSQRLNSSINSLPFPRWPSQPRVHTPDDASTRSASPSHQTALHHLHDATDLHNLVGHRE